MEIGFPFWGSKPDIGAYEYSSAPPANKPVNCSFVSPESGQIFTDSIPSSAIKATAYDLDSTIRDGAGIDSVLFSLLSGTTSMAYSTDNTAPYTWGNIKFLAEGTYTLRATAYGKDKTNHVCEISIVIVHGSSVLHFNAFSSHQDFRIASNPSFFIFYNSGLRDILRFEIMDIAGRRIMQKTITGAVLKVPRELLPQGIIFIKTLPAEQMFMIVNTR